MNESAHASDGLPAIAVTSRLIIAGGPRTGKSTLARDLAARMSLKPNSETNDAIGAYGYGLPVRSTDDLLHKLDWSATSAEVARWFDEGGPWIVEGVVAPRALRKWLAAHPEGKPCDELLYVQGAKVSQNAGQERMTKACWTVFAEIRESLEHRDVVIRFV